MSKNIILSLFAALSFICYSCKKNNSGANASFTVSTFAGGFTGPAGVAVDDNGNVYVADQGNDRIAEVSPSGVVSTFAGGYDGSTNGPGSLASFSFPSGVALDKNGTVYVADFANSLIRKITPAGFVSTLAGMLNTSILSDPYSLAVDKSGNVYVAEQGGSNILKITANGDISVLAGSGDPGSTDGDGLSASFNQPSGIALDASGNVYVADTYNNKIRKISSTGSVSTLAGSGAAGAADGSGKSATFNGPAGLAVDAGGNVYVADTENNKIRKITAAGSVSTLAGNGSPDYEDGPGNQAAFSRPVGIALDAKGNIYVGDSNNNKVRKLTVQ